MCACESVYFFICAQVENNLIHVNALIIIMFFNPLCALYTLNRLLNRVRQRIKKKAKKGSNGNPTIPAITYDKDGEYVEAVPCKGDESIYDNVQNIPTECHVYEPT